MDLSFLKTPVPFPSAAPASISSAQLMPAHARPSMSPEPAARAASTAAAPSSAGLHHVPRRKFTPSAEPGETAFLLSCCLSMTGAAAVQLSASQHGNSCNLCWVGCVMENLLIWEPAC